MTKPDIKNVEDDCIEKILMDLVGKLTIRGHLLPDTAKTLMDRIVEKVKIFKQSSEMKEHIEKYHNGEVNLDKEINQ